MSEVRVDVITFGALQTTLIEVGQQPAELGTDAHAWGAARDSAERMVKVKHDRIFDSADPEPYL